MSIIKGKVLYSRDKLEDPEVDLGGHPNFGEFILSHLAADPAILDQVWLVNAGYDLTGVNRASCGRVLRRYGELEPLSRAVGGTLAELGVGYGSIVQMFVPNNTDYHSVAIGTWLNRGTISLSDPTLGGQILLQQIHETKTEIIIFCDATKDAVFDAIRSERDLLVEEVVPLADTLMSAVTIRRQTTHEVSNGVANGVVNVNVEKPFDADDVVAVFWSSGTTGRPKGIMHAAGYLSSVVVSKGWKLPLQDVILTTCMFHVGGFISPLMLLTKRPVTRIHFFLYSDLDDNVDLLFKACHNYKKVNGLIGGSHHMVRMALSNPPTDDDHQPLDLSGIILAMPVGTTAPGTLFADLKKKFPNLKAVPNFYGMSEFGRTIAYSMNTAVLGVVGAGSSVKIVDPESGEVLGPNQVGEIMAKSDHVMKGYLNRPEETAAFFDPDGFVHTGDLARYDENGILYFEGRLKELIKFKSVHLYPLEIEKVIEEHPEVLEAAVFGTPDPEVQEYVTAAVVLAPSSKLTSDDISDLVIQKLGGVKELRGGVYFIEKLPRNLQGKIQRNKLKELVKSLKIS